jgi:DNA repair exonuclease SbcCD ATPase subunit
MNLLALRITNFRSFTKTQELKFPDTPGLYFMQGVNEAEPRLEANGAGKSTIWDAVCWCVFNKTPKGLKAGEVNNWVAGKGTRVELDFISPSGEERTMVRQWGPILWELYPLGIPAQKEDLTKAKENPVLQWLALEFQPFLQCALMAQGQAMFLDLKSDAQATLFSEVMGLDRWIGYSTLASTKASAQDTIKRSLEREQAKLTGQLSATTRHDFDRRSQDWEDTWKEQIKTIDDEYNAKLAEQVLLNDHHAAALEDETNARAAFHPIKSGVAAMRVGVSNTRQELSSYEMELELVGKKVGELEKQEEDIKHSSECPTCGHQMSRAEGDKIVDKMAHEYGKLNTRLAQIGKQVGKLTALLKQRERALTEAEDQLITAQVDLDSYVADTNAAHRRAEQGEADLDRLEAKAHDLLNANNPYAGLIEQAAYDADKLRDSLAATRQRLDQSQERHSMLSYWVRGFKELRLQLIAEALTELEVEVNSCLAALGLLDWELNFQVDRETKSGGVQRGFSVLVRSPHNANAVPWEAWSGGEAQRLRLACNMGLADLIRARTGTGLDLEVWDEPTRDLSGQGVQDLLVALEARAQQEGRAIWLVDHRTHSFGGFAGGAVVTKTDAGSAISQF